MIELKNLCKTYSLSDGSVEALKDVSLTIPDGDIYGIIGMSGAGKSTLVRCINLLERPTSGSVIIDGRDLTRMTEKELRQERQSITMIFQGFNLLMQKNCLRNVCFPLELAGVKKAEAAQKAQSLLELVGLYNEVSSGMKMSLSAMDILSVLSQGYTLMTSGADFVEFRIPQDGTYSYGSVGSSSVLDVRWKTNKTRFHALLDNEQ